MLPLLLAITMQPQQGVGVCDVLKKPSAYTRRVISVRAKILNALPHGSILVDGRCDKIGLRLGIDLPNADKSVNDLLPALLDDCTPGRARFSPVAGVFRGKISYDAKGELELRLLSVDALDVRSCKPGPIDKMPSSPPALP